MSLLGGILGSTVSGLFARSAARDQAAAIERMYKHRHQWAVADLKKAGLNPILSAGGAAGAVAPPQQAVTPDFAGGIQKGVASALAKKQLDLVDEQSRTERFRQAQLVATARQENARARVAELDAERADYEMQHVWRIPEKAEWLNTARAVREALGGPYAGLAGVGVNAARDIWYSSAMEKAKDSLRDVKEWWEEQQKRLRGASSKEKKRLLNQSPSKGDVEMIEEWERRK